MHRPLTLLGICTIAAAAHAAPPLTIDTATQPSINLRRTVTVQVVNDTKGAVVNISATKHELRREAPAGFDQFFEDSPFSRVVKVPVDSLGSGFIVQREGYVVTNNHVIDRASQISVELSNGQKFPADLISADPDADLAVLRIRSEHALTLPVLQMGDSSDLMIGEPVIAVGNPLGFSHSVSTGIVSALHRDINPDREPPAENAEPAKGEQAALRDLIQTDAAINPGNSGGPLLNAYGQVIGINTAIRGDAQNIGFAIPIDRLRDLVAELMNPAQVTHVDVPVKLIEKRTVTEPATVSVTLVSAAHPEQVLSTINGKHPTDAFDAYAMLLRAKVNRPVTLGWADGSTQRAVPTATPTPDAVVQAREKLGIGIEQNTPVLADKLKLAQEDGLFVTSVARDSVAGRAGLAAGDIIVQLGRYPVPNLDALAALLPHIPSGRGVRVGVIRDNQLKFGLLQF